MATNILSAFGSIFTPAAQEIGINQTAGSLSGHNQIIAGNSANQGYFQQQHMAVVFGKMQSAMRFNVRPNVKKQLGCLLGYGNSSFQLHNMISRVTLNGYYRINSSIESRLLVALNQNIFSYNLFRHLT